MSTREPMYTLRAADINAPAVLQYAIRLARRSKAPQSHIDRLENLCNDFHEWRAANAGRVALVPDEEGDE